MTVEQARVVLQGWPNGEVSGYCYCDENDVAREQLSTRLPGAVDYVAWDGGTRFDPGDADQLEAMFQEIEKVIASARSLFEAP